jgi:MFS family permease
MEGADPENGEYFADERKNFILFVLDGVFFRGSMAFWDPSTVLPSLVHDLFGSRFLTGLIPAFRYGGWYLPQLLVARHSDRMPYKKRLLLAGYLVAATVFSFLALLLFIMPLTALQAMPAIILGLYGFACLGDGICGVPWWALVAKTISPRKRGRLTGLMESLGGLCAFLAGFVVTGIMSYKGFTFPTYYGVLFVIGVCIQVIGILAISLVREPPSEVDQQGSTTLREYMKKAPAILKENAAYRQFVIAKGFLMCHFISLPFYITFAREVIDLPPQIIGQFISFQMLGGMIGSLALGYLADRKGTRVAVMMAAIATFFIPVLPLLISVLIRVGGVSPQAGVVRLLLSCTYVLMGLSNVGSLIAMGNYVVEISAPEDPSLYIGLGNTLIFPTCLLPTLGGILLGWVGYEVLFLISTVLVAIGLVSSIRLKEPRHIPR